MSRIVKVLLMIVLYLLMFVGFLGIISYFIDLSILSNTTYQLVIGIATLVVALILLLVIGKFSDDEDDVDDDMDEGINEDLQETDEQTTTQQPVDQDQTIFMDINSIEVKQTEQQLETSSLQTEAVVEQNELSDDQILVTSSIPIVEEKPNDFIIPTQHIDFKLDDTDELVEVITDEVIQQQEVQPVEQENADVQQLNEVVNEIKQTDIETLKKDLSEMDINLTETQIMYINKSDNSYLNTQGIPQLVMTDELTKPRVFKDETETQETVVETKQESTVSTETFKTVMYDEDDDDLYLTDEKSEKIIQGLTTTILVLIFAILIVGGIYVYTRYLG